jgi:cytochrome P450
MSTHIFVDAASVVPAHRRAAEAAASFVRALVNEAIADRQKAPRADGTVLSRLIKMQGASKGELTDEVIRAFLIGMVMGFVPTNTLAGGNILAMLLRKRRFMAQAQEAALAGDDDLLRRCLFEALRFKHIHWGLTRICTDDYTIAAGTSRKKLVRAGTKVLASTWSAMFDGSRVVHPGVFDSSRRPADYMLLGYGLHWCVGAHIAYAHITQTFKQLLLQKDLRPAEGKAGQLQLLGTFPQHLWVEFTPKKLIKGGVP